MKTDVGLNNAVESTIYIHCLNRISKMLQIMVTIPVPGMQQLENSNILDIGFHVICEQIQRSTTELRGNTNVTQ